MKIFFTVLPDDNRVIVHDYIHTARVEDHLSCASSRYELELELFTRVLISVVMGTIIVQTLSILKNDRIDRLLETFTICIHMH